jgi:hypothetical protein
MFAQDIRKIFHELGEDDFKILSIVTDKGLITPYDVWKVCDDKGWEIPQRTIYNKMKWLSRPDQNYLFETRREPFKHATKKVYYDVTLRGALAALGNEGVSLDGAILDRLRAKLHIPKEYEKAVKPIILMWAYSQSKMPKPNREKVDSISIYQVAMETMAALWGVGSYAALQKELKMPPPSKFKEELGITDEELRTLNMFIFTKLYLDVPVTMEFQKRSLYYAMGLMPATFLSDVIEILPDFVIRVTWAPSKIPESFSKDPLLYWLRKHRDIADLVSKGYEKELTNYLREFTLNLSPFYLLICLRLERDYTCSLKGITCTYNSPLDCDIIKQHARKYKDFLNKRIESLRKK